MQNAVEDDSGLAIGTAKELVETTCKTILEERGIQFDEHDDIAKLVKKTRKALGLVPDNIPDSAKGAEIFTEQATVNQENPKDCLLDMLGWLLESHRL
jgi:hypothetical protein